LARVLTSAYAVTLGGLQNVDRADPAVGVPRDGLEDRPESAGEPGDRFGVEQLRPVGQAHPQLPAGHRRESQRVVGGVPAADIR
jgi:hypothetical protein